MKFSKGIRVKVIEASDVSLTENCEIVNVVSGEDFECISDSLAIDIVIHCKDTYYLFGNGITFVCKDGKK